MGRPFLEKFADVQWEVNEEHLQAWKDGKTGYPIVDAAMRAGKARGEYRDGAFRVSGFQASYTLYHPSLHIYVWHTLTAGWMENRVRMVTACFLVKSLMLDWREWPPLARWSFS
jgi:deoxyribodipyrimidine photo-lyase